MQGKVLCFRHPGLDLSTQDSVGSKFLVSNLDPSPFPFLWILEQALACFFGFLQALLPTPFLKCASQILLIRSWCMPL